jgi:hypothetical protein
VISNCQIDLEKKRNLDTKMTCFFVQFIDHEIHEKDPQRSMFFDSFSENSATVNTHIKSLFKIDKIIRKLDFEDFWREFYDPFMSIRINQKNQ